MLKNLLYAFVIVAGFSAPAAACQFASSSSFYGEDQHIEMFVDSGKICGAALSVGGMLKSVSITQPPKNGGAGARSYYWGYQSKPGFKGKDEFVVTVVTEFYGAIKSSQTHVTVNVK